ncbi:MAG: cation diffusion facilitator family transporter [Thermoguttaceae bacterium]
MSPTQAASFSAHDLYRQTRRAALVGLIVTLSLGVAKLLGGWFGHSLALLSDSFHSLGDALSSVSIFGALCWAERPADTEHPYGHTRVETIAASYVALLLIGSGIWVGHEAIHSWNILAPAPQWYTLIIALVSVALNEGLFRYSMSVARSTGSKAVEASAWDKRLDVFGSLVVLLGLAVTFLAGPEWYAIDHVAALIVACIILFAGGSLFWSSLQELMDRQASSDVLDSIRSTALTVSGVLGVDKLHVRKAGLEYLVDIHIEVDPRIRVTEGHTIGHAVKARLVTEITAVKDVLVHIEPFVDSPLRQS